MSFIYAEAAIDYADEVICELLLKIPEHWLHEALTHRGAVWQGWTASYQQVAGKNGSSHLDLARPTPGRPPKTPGELR